MWRYILRRICYAIPVLLGVNFLTFLLFFTVNTPDHIAEIHLGNKYVTKQQINSWKIQHGYDLPLFYNQQEKNITDTIFWQKSINMFTFNFGISDAGRDINHEIAKRYLPSLSIAIPALLCSVLFDVIAAMLLVFFRNSYLERLGIVLCVIFMSISMLFYIVMSQFLLARILKWLPISGYAFGLHSFKFILLPVFVNVIGGLGVGVRWYRTFLLEEVHKDYVRTARAKGLSEPKIFLNHVLRNSLIPILTNVVAVLPLLFMGSLLLESFFAIPGLGSFTIDAIHEQDFAIVHAMVFLGTLLYILGLILTDISYVVVDPRVKLN